MQRYYLRCSMIHIIHPETDTHIHKVRELFLEYEKELDVDLCFQSFEEELASLPGKYQAPEGALLLGLVNNLTAGCVALRKLNTNTCEMKRLFVRPGFRHMGLGTLLSKKIINHARFAGYQIMYLDTLARLQAAITLYYSLGFQETEPYYHNPLDGVVYLQLDLSK